MFLIKKITKQKLKCLKYFKNMNKKVMNRRGLETNTVETGVGAWF